jgi:hypothetical protein
MPMTPIRQWRTFLLVAYVTAGASCTFTPLRTYDEGTDARPPTPDAAADVPIDRAPPPDLAGDGATCMPVSCNPPGGQYCDMIGDGCGYNMDCGACPTGQVCGALVPNLCGDPACVPLVTSCSVAGGTYCGTIGDGCGRAIVCGDDCTAPEICGGSGVSNLCGKPGCSATSCSFAGGQYCGTVGDGCGHALDCGACPSGTTCDAGKHICIPPGCMPRTSCLNSGVSYCGVIGDGCGGSVNCGTTCSATTACSANVTGICGKPNCTRGTCAFQGGQYCGVIGDGCDNAMDCGACPSGTACDPINRDSSPPGCMSAV